MNSNIVWPAEELISTLFECQTNPPQRILLVEDDEDIRCLSAEVLMDSGYEVDTANDGATAWDALQLKRYDLLVADNKLPKFSGIDLVKQLHAARLVLPVILISEIMPTEELKRQPWLQVKAMLHKPCSLAKLLETVGNVVRAKPAARLAISPALTGKPQPPADQIRL